MRLLYPTTFEHPPESCCDIAGLQERADPATFSGALSFPHGGVAEWSNAHDSKSCVPSRVPGVRIPPPPPAFSASLVLVELRYTGRIPVLLTIPLADGFEEEEGGGVCHVQGVHLTVHGNHC